MANADNSPIHVAADIAVTLDHDRPGTLAKALGCVSAAGINIDAQYLRTNDEVGYVVIDVDTTASQVALEHVPVVSHERSPSLVLVRSWPGA